MDSEGEFTSVCSLVLGNACLMFTGIKRLRVPSVSVLTLSDAKTDRSVQVCSASFSSHVFWVSNFGEVWNAGRCEV